VIHAGVGDVISIPYASSAPRATREELALFEVRDNVIRADLWSSLIVGQGMLELRGLAAGDYDLHLKYTGEKIRIRVVNGPVDHGFVLGSIRQLEVPGLQPVSVQSINTDAEHVNIQLQNHSKFTRVHVFATRYQPAFPAFGNLSRVQAAELGGVLPAHAESVYLTGRNIGDEYRYVLDRHGHRKFPGNMLERPMLLLNPWSLRATETGEQLAAGGDDFRPGGGVHAPAPVPPEPKSEPPSGTAAPSGGNDFANLDFLSDPSAVIPNLIPDKDGVVRIERQHLGPHALITVVAVDPLGTTSRSFALPEMPSRFVDLRLKNGLDPTRHFTQQRLITVVTPGQQFQIDDVVNSRFQFYDSLAKIYSFYSTLNKDPNLIEFGFILQWPKLKPEQKREFYSRYACHELNFFLFKKDAQFFADVVQPFLRNKKDKTFLDHWLIGDEVTRFLKPWEYGRLNTVEKILLAQRLPGESERTARHLSDLLRLVPRNIDRDLLLFNVGLLAGGLHRDDTLIAQIEEERLRRESRDQKKLENEFNKPGQSKPDPAKPTDPDLPAAPGGVPTPGMSRPTETSGGGVGGRPGSRTPSKDSYLRRDDQMPAAGKPNEVDYFFEEGAERRQQVRQLYRKIDPTMEWAENNYYKLRIHKQIADLVPVSDFWLDYARHDGRSPFLSRHFGSAGRSFTEILFALSVLDLPFETPQHDVHLANGQMTVKPAGHLIAFPEEIRPAAGKGGQIPILVSQNFFRNGDRFYEDGGEK
jgi:hypothetical protein